MAKDGLSDCARIYAEAKGAAIETAEKFIYVLMVQLFMKNLDTRDTLPSAVGLIRELMGEPPGDRKMNEFAMATLLLAGSTRTASVSLETDFSAIEQKARREKRVDPRLSEASHYETQSDSRVVRFFEPSQSHPEYRAIIWKLRNGDMLFH